MHKTRIKFVWNGMVYTVSTNPTMDKLADRQNANMLLQQLLEQGGVIISVRPLVKR